MNSHYTRHDDDMLEVFKDPALWAEHHLGEKPRWYQEQILRHPHHRKVLRCGRRIGKCIEATQRVVNPVTGAYETVESLYQDYEQNNEQKPELLTLDESYQLKQSEAFLIEDNGMKDTFRVRTRYGADVILTGNHPVLTLDGWKEVDALQIGDRIATPKSIDAFGSEEMDDNEIKLFAYLIAGGYYNGSRLTFSAKENRAYRHLGRIAKRLGLTVREAQERKATCIIEGFDKTLLDSLFEEKRIPPFVFSLNEEDLSTFLSHLYSINGWAFAGKKPEIGYHTVSYQLAKDIKHLLLRFGIHTNLQHKNSDGSKSYQLVIHRSESVLSFIEKISIAHKEDDVVKVMERAEAISSYEYTVPVEVWSHIEKRRFEKNMSKGDLAGSPEARLRTKRPPTESTIRDYADKLEDAFLYDLGRSDLLWEDVTAITPMGERQTYDVFVPETHNLVVEDVLVHNTWTMTAHMLWVAFTCNGGMEIEKGATCLVATPYDSQAREIFDQLNNFIDNSDVLKASVDTIRRSPYEIIFKNKSRIKLFTAGTRSGAEGGSLRGQKASWLYFDEMDFLGDKDFEAIYAISLEAPKRIGIMAASTPTGRRGKFYDLCMNTHMQFSHEKSIQPDEDNKYDAKKYNRSKAKGWKEFHFPTMVNPEWDKDMEQELSNIYDKVGYEHEVLAEFGTETVGVFNKDFIDEASSNGYSLVGYPKYDYPITIGIDWDKSGAATQIVVTQFDPTIERREKSEDGKTLHGRFRLINRVEIPKSEFTYDNAVKKIKELDEIYNPVYIYPDRGAGEYQLEMLRKALGDKVKGIHLGSSHPVRDPITGEIDKKPIKPFMVGQTNLLLERGMIQIPHADVDEELRRQMLSYRVVKISAKTGEPTYSAKDEHALDAYMLSILAFIIEMPDIAKTIDDFKVARTMFRAEIKHQDPLRTIQHQDFSSKDSYQEYVKRWDEPTPPPPRKTRIGNGKADRNFTWGRRGSGSTSVVKRKSW